MKALLAQVVLLFSWSLAHGQHLHPAEVQPPQMPIAPLYAMDSADVTQLVTFRVDLRLDITGWEGVYLAGDFNGWNPLATPMIDEDGDDIWEVTLELPLGTYFFKYVNNGNSWEYPPLECSEPTYHNRVIEVVDNGGEPLVYSACYDGCATECAPLPTSNITFQVDMSAQVISDEGVWLMSTLMDNWYFNDFVVPLEDPDGDMIYTITLPVSNLLKFYYVFMNGNPFDENPSNIQNYETIEGSCAWEWGYRIHWRSGEPEVLPVVCYNQCDANCAPTPGCTDVAACNFNPSATFNSNCEYPAPGLDCLGRCMNPDAANGALNEQPHILLYAEDFSDFAPGSGVVQNDPSRWIYWFPDAGTELDAQVVAEEGGNTALRVWIQDNPFHQTDVVLLLDQSEGLVDLSFDLNIQPGHGAYINFQGTSNPGEFFGPEMYFWPNGDWALWGPNYIDLSGSGFPIGSWVNIQFTIDLDADVMWLYIDQVYMGQESLSVDLGGVDFFAAASDPTVAGAWSSDYLVDNIRLARPALSGVSLACQIPGCTYPDADNYTSEATWDNGTCVFSTSSACLGDLNGDSQVTVPDLLLLLGAFGAPCASVPM